MLSIRSLSRPVTKSSPVRALLVLVSSVPVLTATPVAPSAESFVESVVALAVSTDADHPDRVYLCSGALIAPNLVLTARHCLSRLRTTTPSCDARGRSPDGSHFEHDYPPASVAVYTGAEVDLAKDSPRARGKRLFRPTDTVLCDADIAYLELDRPLVGHRPLSVAAEEEGAATHLVGIGYRKGETPAVVRRVVRQVGKVMELGPRVDTNTGKTLGPRELELSGGTDEGDSGGPAIDVRRGTIVAVTSRGGPNEGGNHVYTRVAFFESLTREARRAAISR